MPIGERRSPATAAIASATESKASSATARSVPLVTSRTRARVTMPSVPSLPVKQRREVVPGVVARQPGEVRHQCAGPEHRFDADDLRAGIAVAHHPSTAGVRGDGAADRRAVAAGEVDAVSHTDRGGGSLKPGDRHAGAHGRLRGCGVDVDLHEPP